MASVPKGMRLVSEMGVVTLTPGRWPPIPGLAPWPILITTAWPFVSVLASTPNLADAHWTVILLHSATSFRRPPSPVPAIIPVRSAAFAMAAFGTPESAPKDMSPRYIGEESLRGEPAAKRMEVSAVTPCLGASVRLRYNLVERPASPLGLREPELAGGSPGLRELPDVEDLPLGPELPGPRSRQGHVALEFDRLSLRQTGNLNHRIPVKQNE